MDEKRGIMWTLNGQMDERELLCLNKKVYAKEGIMMWK